MPSGHRWSFRSFWPYGGTSFAPSEQKSPFDPFGVKMLGLQGGRAPFSPFGAKTSVLEFFYFWGYALQTERFFGVFDPEFGVFLRGFLGVHSVVGVFLVFLTLFGQRRTVSLSSWEKYSLLNFGF